MDPGTMMLIASAVAAATKGAEGYFSKESEQEKTKRRIKEAKRETLAGLVNNALGGSAELAEQQLAGRSRLGKRRTQNMQNTSDLIRGSFNI